MLFCFSYRHRLANCTQPRPNLFTMRGLGTDFVSRPLPNANVSTWLGSETQAQAARRSAPSTSRFGGIMDRAGERGQTKTATPPVANPAGAHRKGRQRHCGSGSRLSAARASQPRPASLGGVPAPPLNTTTNTSQQSAGGGVGAAASKGAGSSKGGKIGTGKVWVAKN